MAGIEGRKERIWLSFHAADGHCKGNTIQLWSVYDGVVSCFRLRFLLFPSPNPIAFGGKVYCFRTKEWFFVCLRLIGGGIPC